jgi:hypothetical protein
VRDTGEVFKLIEDIKKILRNINFYTSIYPAVGIGIGDIKFSEKYKMPAERAGRKIITNIKNSTRPQSLNKRRKLIRL